MLAEQGSAVAQTRYDYSGHERGPLIGLLYSRARYLAMKH